MKLAIELREQDLGILWIFFFGFKSLTLSKISRNFVKSKSMNFEFKDNEIVAAPTRVTLPSQVGNYLLNYEGKPYFSPIGGATLYTTLIYTPQEGGGWEKQILEYRRPSRYLYQEIRPWLNRLSPDEREKVRQRWENRLRELCGVPKNQKVRLDFHTSALLPKKKGEKTRGVWKMTIYYWPPKEEKQPLPKPADHYGPMAASMRAAFFKFEREWKAGEK